MKTKLEIDESIAALAPAPDGETLEQVAVRVAAWLLSVIADEHPSIAACHGLYRRAVAGDMPSSAEWAGAESAVNLDLGRARAFGHALDIDPDFRRALGRALGRDRAPDPDLGRARSRGRTLALDLALDLACARALVCAFDSDLDLGRARASLVRALSALLVNRVAPMIGLHTEVAALADDGNLDMGMWHCGTSHCRAGAAVTVHPIGPELERVFGPALAGGVIYFASTGSVPNFYAGQKEALADIRRCAAEEAAA